MKLWGGRFRKEENRVMEDFNTSFPFDHRLYREDISGSIAHVMMLGSCGILTMDEASQIRAGLEGILRDIESGDLPLDGAHEDIHTFVEVQLTERIGDLGKKLHTGRSRNDQVAVDMRMYARTQAENLIAQLKSLTDALTSKGEEYPCIMPGYTHLQRAQAVTFRYYMQAYVSMFSRDAKRISSALQILNENPLGAAALAGTTHAIDRTITTEALHFSKPVDNFLDAVSDRDYLIELMSDMSIIMMHLSRLCEELILWSSQEFRFVSIDDAYATGSSIMPQKKNPDACELVRGKTGRVYGDLTALLTTMKGLPLAYNKDMQEDKPQFFDAVDTVSACLEIMTLVISTLRVHADVMEQSVRKGFLNATEVADYLVAHGCAFRDAHAIVGRIVIFCEDQGRAIEELTLEELKGFSDLFEDSIYEYIDYQNILRKGNKREML